MSRETTIKEGVYTRQLFLDEVEVNDDDCEDIRGYVKELIEFISSLEQSAYCSNKIERLAICGRSPVFIRGDGRRDYNLEQSIERDNRAQRQLLVDNKNEIKTLLVELLNSQSWADESRIYNIEGDLVMGDKPAGDKVDIGNITNAQGVAVGRDSQAGVVGSKFP